METPIIDGYKKIIKLVKPANNPPRAYGEFTILDEPTVDVNESNKPASAPETSIAIQKKIIE